MGSVDGWGWTMADVIDTMGLRVRDDFEDKEPRIRDLELAKRLGYANPYNIRKLIRQLADAGKLPSVCQFSHSENRSDGRPSKPGHEFWLDERSAIKVIAKSETDAADQILDEVIDVFMAYRHGKLMPRLLADDFCEWDEMWSRQVTGAMCRLYGQQYDGGRPPKFLGSVQRKIYRLVLEPHVYAEMKLRNGEPHFGSNHHQLLTEQARSRFRDELRQIELAALWPTPGKSSGRSSNASTRATRCSFDSSAWASSGTAPMFDELEYVHVHADFLALAGGEIWDRVVAAAWQQRERERASSTVKQAEFRSRQHGRLYHRDYERQRRQRNKQIVRKIRCCPECRKMFALNATQVADKHGGYCSRHCFGRANIRRHRPNPPRMVTIGGKTKPLPQWAEKYGITIGMVYRRMRKGMNAVEALTGPKTRGTGVSQRRAS